MMGGLLFVPNFPLHTMYTIYTVSGSAGSTGETARAWYSSGEGEWQEMEAGPSLPHICSWRTASR